MISYEDAKIKAISECPDYDLIEYKEDENYFRFCFGLKNELPLLGMPEILINKRNGEITFFNAFTELQKKHKNDKLISY